MKRPLSIALFGNTNNYPLLLAEGIVALGHKVRLFVNRKDLLHRPESKHPDWAGNYPAWIHDCSSLIYDDLTTETPVLEGIIDQFDHGADLAILNDVGPALAGHLKCPYVALLTGSDLTYYGNCASLDLRSASWRPEFKGSAAGQQDIRRFAELVKRQRDGILNAEIVSFAVRGLIPEGDKLLDSIGVPDDRRTMIYLSDTLHVNKVLAPKNQTFRIFNGCRLLWRQTDDFRYSALDLKGTDILVKGFALYCAQGGGGELRMPRKGQDLEATVALVSELGIARRIVWLEEMSLETFRNEMAAADVVCDQLALAFPGLVTTDAYAMGRPVLANFRNEILGPHFGSPLPGLQASTPEQVCESFLAAERDRGRLERIGLDSRAFAEAHLSPERMAKHLLSRVERTIKETKGTGQTVDVQH